MPIKAAQSLLKIQLKSALNKKESANPDQVAVYICKAIATAASKGLRPIKSKPYYVPLIPTGVGSASNKLKKVFKSFPKDTPGAMNKMADVVAAVAPKCKKIGLSALRSKLTKSGKITGSNNIEKSANEWAAAIIAYYIAGGIK